MQTPEEVVVESRKRRISERLERRGTYRQFIKRKGYWCEACGWSIEEDEEDVWASSFELHHLTPFSELKEGGSWVVSMEDFAVLCASCHRAIHRNRLRVRYRTLYKGLHWDVMLLLNAAVVCLIETPVNSGRGLQLRECVGDALLEDAVAAVKTGAQLRGSAEIGVRGENAEAATGSRHAGGIGR